MEGSGHVIRHCDPRRWPCAVSSCPRRTRRSASCTWAEMSSNPLDPKFFGGGAGMGELTHFRSSYFSGWIFGDPIFGLAWVNSPPIFGVPILVVGLDRMVTGDF